MNIFPQYKYFAEDDGNDEEDSEVAEQFHYKVAAAHQTAP